MDVIDQPTAVRAGEELDAAALAAYLGRAVPAFADVTAAELEIRQFGAGFSNLTYLVRAGEAEVVLRRPPFGARGGSAHDMAREHRILSALAPTYGKVPRPLGYCDDAGVLQRVLDRAIQVHGAAGLTDETPLAFWWAHERGARIYDGPDEVHKSSVARRILKRYGMV